MRETALAVSGSKCPWPVTCGHSVAEERGLSLLEIWLIEIKRVLGRGLSGAKGVPIVSLFKEK